MNEPINDPPLVQRVEEAEATHAPQPQQLRPGFWEAVAWCILFLGVQVFFLTIVAMGAFAVFALSAKEPAKFLEDFGKEFDNTNGTMPRVLAQALAWGMLGSQIGSLGLVLLVLPRRVGRDWKRQLGVRRPHWLHLLLVLLILPGFIVLPDALQALVRALTGLEPAAMGGTLTDVFGALAWPLVILAVGVGPGIVEEFWCRGFLGRGLCGRYGFFGGVVLTSLLFALMHLNPIEVLSYMLLGTLLHFVYFASRSIWVPILLHALNNSAAVVMMLTIPPAKLAFATPRALWVAAFALVVVGCFAFWTSRAKLVPAMPTDEHWHEGDIWQPEYAGVSAPPPGAAWRLGYEKVNLITFVLTVLSCAMVVYIAYNFLR